MHYIVYSGLIGLHTSVMAFVICADADLSAIRWLASLVRHASSMIASDTAHVKCYDRSHLRHIGVRVMLVSARTICR